MPVGVSAGVRKKPAHSTGQPGLQEGKCDERYELSAAWTPYLRQNECRGQPVSILLWYPVAVLVEFDQPGYAGETLNVAHSLRQRGPFYRDAAVSVLD